MPSSTGRPPNFFKTYLLHSTLQFACMHSSYELLKLGVSLGIASGLLASVSFGGSPFDCLFIFTASLAVDRHAVMHC